MKKNSLCFGFVLLFLLVTKWSLAADSTATIFAKAVQAQENSQHEKAIVLYEKILATEMRSPDLYNNLGLAYYNNKKLGLAIVQFERALRCSPNHADAKHNLQAANQRLTEAYQVRDALFFVQWWNSTVTALSSTAWAVLFLLFIFGGVGAVVLWQWKNQTLYKNIAIVVFSCSFLPLIWGFQKKEIEVKPNTAIVINEQVGLRQSPDLSGEEIELIFEGVKVTILEEKDSWTHIELPNNLIGWVPSTMIERI